ncbi:hypothetical protein WMY93_020323 [Mugilogobius chulae]|uniref:Bulb-type lectin domain-containing protein n=1 Tax=Mugilogobius chulae TaxID=88201 RepID=A0AAW0NS15_9GOBI
MSKSFISSNQDLRKGDCLVSNNGNYKAVFQEDGNFVLYEWKPVWATNTVGSGPCRIVLQDDSNLAMYSKSECTWCTGNYVKGGNCQRLRLTVTDQGRLEVENDGKMIWNNEQGRV